MTRYTIKLFMWPFQGHMQGSLEYRAETLFRTLDPRLNPRIVLVGVLDEEREGSYPICLEPEDCGYSVEIFSGVEELAVQLQELDEQNRIFVGDARCAKRIAKEVVDRSYANAIKSIIKTRDYYDEKELFVAVPSYIKGYQVFTVLILDKKAFDNHYSFTKQKESQFSRCPISRSFIESTVKVFLNECTAALNKSEEPSEATKRGSDELLREAGADFVKTVGWAGGGLEGTGIYEACNDISALKYEGAVGIGDMIIAPQGHPNVRLSLELANPIRIHNHRMVRKFLELSNNTTSIVSDAAFIYGLGEIRGNYNPQEENLFVIQFLSHYKWRLLHNRNPMLVVEYREPALPKDKIDRKKFYSDLPRVFQGITKEQIDNLWEIAIEATTQKHGTMLVISDDAKNESVRLGRQCFVVKPFKLADEKISQVTAIDGAVLVDRDCICHAIGVILDGLATKKGDPARGARYNSAIRYYESVHKQTPLVIVIISEDGMINLIPDLMPQVKHSDITKAIADFKKVYESEEFDRKSYFPLINSLESVEFYLSKSECDEINSCRKNIEEKFNEEFGPVHFVRNDLKPHEEMNESYYFVEN